MKTPTRIDGLRVETVPHGHQRYDTVGDYVFCGPDGAQMYLTVSEMGDWRFGIACAIHEIIEASLLVTNKIEESDVSEFDKDYESARAGDEAADLRYRRRWRCHCPITEDSEPGQDVHAPYHREHMFADGIERLVLRELGARWPDYEEAVGRLEYRPSHDPFGENGEESEDADG